MRIFGWIIGFMSNVTSTILTESGTNELEIIEFHLEKNIARWQHKNLLLRH
ncbi:chemotaxis protein CheV [Vibrio sp. JCM 19053]|nr:chemotaxis protein CheV [Vibrio sp. JCM 19053]